MNYFYRERAWKFCEDEQRIHDPEQPKEVIPALFNSVKFQGLMDLVESGGILNDVSYDKKQAKILAKNIDNALQALCREKEKRNRHEQ